MFKCFFTLQKMHQYTIASYLCWCYLNCKIIEIRNISLFNEAVVLHPLHKFFIFFFGYGNHQGLLLRVGNGGGGGGCSAADGMMGIASRWGQGSGDGLVHQLVHGLEALGALRNEKELVVHYSADGVAGGDAGENQGTAFAAPRSDTPQTWRYTRRTSARRIDCDRRCRTHGMYLSTTGKNLKLWWRTTTRT